MAKISIIMGIYNCADTLCEAIDSILAKIIQLKNFQVRVLIPLDWLCLLFRWFCLLF